jgi:hypothetical protein
VGSFHKVCGITGMTIQWGEPCYVTRLERQKHVYRQGAIIFKPDQEWQPISFPQLTSYYDYGRVDEDFKPNPLNEFLGLNVEDGEEDRTIDTDDLGAEYSVSDTLFLIHPQAYQKFSSKVIDPDDLFNYRRTIFETGPSYFIDAFEEAKKMTESALPDDPVKHYMFHMYLENSHAFGWNHSKIGWKIFNKINDAKSYEPLDRAVSLGLAEELYKQFIFETNMDQMWKSYRPSNYGGQYDNYETYLELADVMIEIAAEKRLKIDAEDGDYDEDEDL